MISIYISWGCHLWAYWRTDAYQRNATLHSARTQEWPKSLLLAIVYVNRFKSIESNSISFELLLHSNSASSYKAWANCAAAEAWIRFECSFATALHRIPHNHFEVHVPPDLPPNELVSRVCHQEKFALLPIATILATWALARTEHIPQCR